MPTVLIWIKSWKSVQRREVQKEGNISFGYWGKPQLILIFNSHCFILQAIESNTTLHASRELISNDGSDVYKRNWEISPQMGMPWLLGEAVTARVSNRCLKRQAETPKCLVNNNLRWLQNPDLVFLYLPLYWESVGTISHSIYLKHALRDLSLLLWKS